MVSHEDLLRLWGESNVVQIDPTEHLLLHLPRQTAETLARVGLPRRIEMLFEARELQMVDVPHLSGRYCMFGSDLGTELCISVDTGVVLSLSLNRRYPDRFVNTTLALFLEFLVLVTIERAALAHVRDQDIDARIAALESRLRQMDERALADPDNWWSVIIEQMRDGFL